MKYRRDISHILRPIAILLGLFVLYQVWITPTYLSPPTPLPIAEAPAPSPSLTPSALDNFGPSDVPPTRLIDPGDAPSTRLSQIREDLDRGNYKNVESNLRKLSPQTLRDDRANTMPPRFGITSVFSRKNSAASRARSKPSNRPPGLIRTTRSLSSI